MGQALDALNQVTTHVTALEARDAAVAAALTDVRSQLTTLSQNADDPAAVAAAVTAIGTRLDNLDNEAPSPAPAPNTNPPTNPPATGS